MNYCNPTINITKVYIEKPEIFIGQNLKYLRVLRGIKQYQLAGILKINLKTYSAQERSEHFPDPIQIKKYCDFFGVRAHLFMFTNIKENV